MSKVTRDVWIHFGARHPQNGEIERVATERRRHDHRFPRSLKLSIMPARVVL